MGRKLTKNEKMLVVVLIAAVFALGYYYLFWDKITKRIESNKVEISALQIRYDDCQKKIGGLEELRAKLAELESQPTYNDKFYPGDEVQETYIDYLHKIVVDNDLQLESIAFSKEEVELPAAPAPTPSAAPSESGALATPAPAAPDRQEAASPQARFILNNATITFTVDYKKPDSILKALSTIEGGEKMAIINKMRLEVLTSEPKAYKCTAVIQFVGLSAPQTQQPDQDESGVYEVPVTVS
jgi:hypothetical protein